MFTSVPETLKFECELIEQGVIPKPRMAIIVNSYKCNQACYFCFHRPYNNGYTMPTHEVMKLIDELAEYGVKSLDWCGGGDPLCAPDMDKVFRRGAMRGLKQCLISNGVLFEGQTMEAAIDTCTFIRISLDTVDRELYQKVHGADHLPIVLENIKKALEYKEKTKSTCELSVKVSLFKEITLEDLETVKYEG